MSPEELDAADEGVHDPTSLDKFLVWAQFGGLERGLSLEEIEGMDMPTLLDWQFYLRRLGSHQRRKRWFKDHLVKR